MRSRQDIEKKYSCITKKIKQKLSIKRYNHTIGVALEAFKLAKNYKIINVENAIIAGLLHDYARELSNKELLDYAHQFNLVIDNIEYRKPILLHGPVASFLVKKDFNIYNKEILHSITYHTTGCSNMNTLDMIIYIADMIEANRQYSGVERLRSLAYENIKKAVEKGLEKTILYTLERSDLLHKLTIDARNDLIIKRS